MNTWGEYISLQEASKLCRYSQEYLSLRARSGKLKAVKQGRTWLTKKEWLDEYLSHAASARPKFHGQEKVSSKPFPKITFNPVVLAFVLIAVGYGGYAYADSAFSIENAVREISDKSVELSDYLYYSSAESSRNVMRSYTFADSSLDYYFSIASRSLANRLENGVVYIADTSNTKYFLSASFLDAISSPYKTANRQVSSFLGNAYIKAVQALIPGYSPML